MNEALRDAVQILEKVHDEVRTQNEELLRLATIALLTECLNLRAFFGKPGP